jgi:hypothetical protein
MEVAKRTFTTVSAALSRSSTVMMRYPDASMKALASFTLVPCRRSTTGLRRPIFLAAAMTPWAITSHLRNPARAEGGTGAVATHIIPPPPLFPMYGRRPTA